MRLPAGLQHLKQLFEDHVLNVGLKAVQSCQETRDNVVCNPLLKSPLHLPNIDILLSLSDNIFQLYKILYVSLLFDLFPTTTFI